MIMHSLQILLAFCLLLGQSRLLPAAEVKPAEKTGIEPEENLTEAESDEAEFRQGGIGQQLGLSGYGLYAGASSPGLQYAAAASNAGNGGYVNMLRNLYRPQQASMGLTDKVKHWVKSFMNRRQYVKPYYSPSGLQYTADEFSGGKPMFVGSGYKAISVPLRQLQKYYKPMYAGDSGASQLGSAGSSSMLSYNPSGIYTAGDGTQFSGSSLFGGDSNAAAALFASGGSSAGGNNPFASYGGGQGAGLFSSSQGGGESPTSALFGSQGLYGSAGSSGSQSGSSSNSGLYPSASGSYSLDGSSSNGGNLFASESGNSPYFGSGGSRFLNGGGSSSAYGGDLFASGASPAASVYNPGEQGGRGYGAKKMPPSYGSSGGALYMSSSDQRAAESSASYTVKEPPSGFDGSSRGGSPPESHSYSVSFQPTSAQGKSYSGGNSGFQPVSFEYPGKSS